MCFRPAEIAMNKCAACGAPNKPIATECVKCGAPLENVKNDFDADRQSLTLQCVLLPLLLLHQALLSPPLALRLNPCP